jgi:L-fuculose-phosphate aldolase
VTAGAAAELLAALAPRFHADGLAVGTAGNASVRLPHGALAITPTGVPYDRVRAGDISVVDRGGRLTAGLAPSSELALHRAVYGEREDAGAIVHTHSPRATALAVAGREIPAIHYLVAPLGGRVPLVPYHPYGSEELARAAAAVLRPPVNACLLAHHGVVTLGSSLAEAYERAVLVEWLAFVYGEAARWGEPPTLDPSAVAEAARRLASYGQPRA